MSVAVVASRAAAGVEAPPVTVEVFLSGGLPRFSIVGLPETAVRESKDRVRGAILSSGFEFPDGHITVGLAPADMPKSGGRFDLPIALGILAAAGRVPRRAVEGYEFYGELAMVGALRAVPGLLPAGLKAKSDGRILVVPAANAAEAALSDATVLSAGTLLEVTAHLNGEQCLERVAKPPLPPACATAPDLRDVRGQARAKRALEIAAAGGHNLLFIGPPGTGKSMLARRLPGILPPMSDAEALETGAIDSILGRPLDLERWRLRPFRAPHHTASPAALVGGGSNPRPGEISRAHNGVLFLDELPEFNRNVLEALREPLEAGSITISRADRQCDFPARFQLVAAMNPCPCGYHGDPGGYCRCSAERVASYRGKVSGPLLDRIDLHVEVGRPPRAVFREDAPSGETSAEVARRVLTARQRATARGGVSNAGLDPDAVARACRTGSDARALLEQVAGKFGLSIRACHRVLRVARTIADLDASEQLSAAHVAEAISLRVMDRAQ